MRTETKVAAKKTQVKLIGIIICFVLALATYLILQFTVTKEQLGFSQIWMLFIVLFMSTGLFLLVMSAIQRRTLWFVSGGGSFIIGLAILLFCLHRHIPWFVTIIIIVVLLIIMFLLTFTIKAPDLKIEYDNGPGSDRKPYEERKAEADAKREAERRAEKEKPLPTVQSFAPDKDEEKK